MTHCYRPIRIQLKAPALFSYRAGDPNSASTLPYVPGSALRGAVASALMRQGVHAGTDGEFERLVLSGAVRYLNAYPCEGDLRSLPIPVSWVQPKYEGSVPAGFDLAAYGPSAAAVADHDWPEEQLEPPAAAFATLTAARVLEVQVRKSSRVHHQRDRRVGRPREGTGAMFSYESLDAGQVFAGFLQAVASNETEATQLLDRVTAALRCGLLLGRSRISSYGGDADIEVAAGHDSTREVLGSGVLAGNVAAGAAFRILLSSPCIARDPSTGQIDPGALPGLLEQRFGGLARIEASLWASRDVGAFNRAWGLETPQRLAVNAGSVLVVRALQELPEALWKSIENDGIGEGRVEGFGRMVFLEAPQDRFELHSAREPALTLPVPQGSAPDLVVRIEERLVRQQLDAVIARRAASDAARWEHLPSGSLLGHLRVPLRGRPADAVATLLTWLGDTDNALKRPAREQLEKCRPKGGLRGQNERNLRLWLTRRLEPGTVASPDGCLRTDLALDRLAVARHLVSPAGVLTRLSTMEAEVQRDYLDKFMAALQRRIRSTKGR